MCELTSVVCRRPVGDLPSFDFFRLSRGVSRLAAREFSGYMRIFTLLPWPMERRGLFWSEKCWVSVPAWLAQFISGLQSAIPTQLYCLKTINLTVEIFSSLWALISHGFAGCNECKQRKFFAHSHLIALMMVMVSETSDFINLLTRLSARENFIEMTSTLVMSLRLPVEICHSCGGTSFLSVHWKVNPQTSKKRNWVTNSLKQISSWKAYRFLSSQNVSRILWNPKVHYRIPYPERGRSSPRHPSHSLKIHFNIIFSSTPGSSRRSSSIRFSH